MTYDERLEKPNYWNEDNEFIAPKQSIFRGASLVRSDQRAKSVKPHSQYLYEKSKPKTKQYSVPWSGINEYIKSCQLSKERNMKTTK